MRFKLIFISIALTIISNSIQAQDLNVLVPRTQFLERIIHNKEGKMNQVTYSLNDLKIIPIHDSSRLNGAQNILTNNRGMYIVIDGTGIVYKYDSTSNSNKNLISFKRIDQTIFGGYNFKNLVFSENDRIYNMGGYGYWRNNGQLRIFNEFYGDWVIEPITTEVPVFDNKIRPYAWFNKFKKQVYLLYENIENEALLKSATNDNRIVDSVKCFDFIEKKWTTLGKLDNVFKNKLVDAYTITNTPYGLCVYIGNTIEFWNISENNISVLKNNVTNKFPLSKMYQYVYWYQKPFIYFSDKTNGNIDSISINEKNLDVIERKIYSYKNNYINFWTIFLILAIIFLSFAIIIYNKKKQEKLEVTHISSDLKSSYKQTDIFSEIEKLLIQLLIINIKANERLTSIEEVNYALGISNKTLNMQKRTRSDIITSINSKFKIATKTTNLLIKRRNSEHDQRVKEFYIDDSDLITIEVLL